MAVSNEQIMEKLVAMDAALTRNVADHERRLLVIERTGIPVICRDREDRLRVLERGGVSLLSIVLCFCAAAGGAGAAALLNRVLQ